MPASEAVVDLDVLSANVAGLRAGTPAEVMAVVKADGYGHGLLPSARAALRGGASWLGVAQLREALDLRAGGITAPVLAWLWTPGETAELTAAIAAGVDVSVASVDQLGAVQQAVRDTGRPARIHAKIDTGLARNGATAEQWPALLDAVGKARAAAEVETVGVWSHFVHADAPGHPTTTAQIDAFSAAVAEGERIGLTFQLKHLANSAATLTLPAAHFDLVRPGIAVYGLNPVPAVPAPGLTPVMTLRSELALTKRVPAGQGVSYGHTYVTDRETTLALVPLGYADGIPRAATNIGPISVNGRRYTISGRVCMDQVVVDVNDADVHAGDEVIVFGPPGDGRPTAQDWADTLDTIHYEIVTRIGTRVPRRYVGTPA